MIEDWICFLPEPLYWCALLRPHKGDTPAGRQRRGDGLHQRQLRRRLQAEECLHIHAGTSAIVVKQSMKGEMKKENKTQMPSGRELSGIA